jgi:hypothetical protein
MLALTGMMSVAFQVLLLFLLQPHLIVTLGINHHLQCHFSQGLTMLVPGGEVSPFQRELQEITMYVSKQST